MKLHYHCVILLSLGSFLPTHGMWLFGSGEGKENKVEQKEATQKEIEENKKELQKKIKNLLINKNLKKILEGDDIDESIIYIWDLVEKNKSVMKEKFEQEIKDIPAVGSIVSFATQALNGVGLDISQKMVDGMVEKRNGIRLAFRLANGEEKKKENPINVFDELSNIDKKEKSDLVRKVTLCFLIKIDLCLKKNQEKLTERFQENSPFAFKPLIPGIINSAVKKSSGWHDSFIAMAEHSLCQTEDDKK